MNDNSIMLAKKSIASNFNHTEHIYIDICGDLVAGTLLSQIIYWFKPSSDGKMKVRVFHDGKYWLAKSRDEWWDEIRITPRQFDYAIKSLINLGFVEKRVFKFNGTPMVHIRPIAENINLATDKWIQDYAEKIENIEFSDNEKSQISTDKEPINNENSPILTNCQNGNLQNVKMDIDKSVKSITENTYREYNTENTYSSNLIFVDNNNKNLSMNTSIHNTSAVSTTDEPENHIEEVYFSQTGQIEISLSKAYEDIQLKRDTTSQEKITDFFLYFVERYTEHTGHKPYPIKYDKLITFVKRLVDSKLINGGRDSILNYDTDEIEWMIDDYFDYDFEDCNYSIHHFMSKKILSTRFRRLQNKYPKTA